jgi:uncharacterized protein (TIGR02145 family)
MAQNLNYPMGNSWCYENKDENCQKYGRLYDWETARKACPSGWHLPSDEEWTAFAKSLDDASFGNVGKKLKSASWDGTDAVGFHALAGGVRGTDGSFGGTGSSADFWSSAEFNAQDAWSRTLYAGRDALNRYRWLQDRWVQRSLPQGCSLILPLLPEQAEFEGFDQSSCSCPLFLSERWTRLRQAPEENQPAFA